MRVSDLQKQLGVVADGIVGPVTERAVINVLTGLSNQIPSSRWRTWSVKRKLNAYMQLILKEHGHEVGLIDGLVGPQTRHALAVHRGEDNTWRDDTDKEIVQAWPHQRNVRSFYGNVGEHQTRIELPYTMKLAWDTKRKVNKMTLHEKVAPSAQRVLERVLDHYGPQKIKDLRLDYFGGSLNVRKMRGGSAWSMHSWGIAIDFDPIRNQLRWGRDKASLAKREYQKFWELWEDEGWYSLGRRKNYDWMHVQAARI